MKTLTASLSALILLLAVAVPAQADVGFVGSTDRAGAPGDRIEVTIGCGFCFPPCVGEPGDKHAPGDPHGICNPGNHGGPPASFQVWITPVGHSLDPYICGPGERVPGAPPQGPCRAGSRPPHLPSFIHLGRAMPQRRGVDSKEIPRYRLIFAVPEARPGLYKYVLFCDSCVDGPRGSLVDDRGRAAGPLRVLPAIAQRERRRRGRRRCLGSAPGYSPRGSPSAPAFSCAAAVGRPADPTTLGRRPRAMPRLATVAIWLIPAALLVCGCGGSDDAGSTVAGAAAGRLPAPDAIGSRLSKPA